MALLKCKMCGGSVDVDKNQNLAICPYCGAKSTVYEQDRKLFEQFQTMFAALLDKEPGSAAEEGFWIDAKREELLREDGKTIEISYFMKMKADMCMMYVAKEHVLYVFEKEYEKFADNYVKMAAAVRYPNHEMEKELRRYMPQVAERCRLDGGGIMIAVKKEREVYPLKLLGVLIDRHVAWIISRLENICCLLSYNGMVLNGLTMDNLFVSPGDHQIYVYGGWWFAGYEGSMMNGISGDARKYIYRKYLEKKRSHPSTDLEALRYAAAKLLGYETREEAADAKLLPEAFKEFITDTARESAQKDFSEWDRVLKKSYGERKFIPLRVTEEELYGQTE